LRIRGFSDADRLACEELVYTGVVRTPLMALADRIPFGGQWIPAMAEHFATQESQWEHMHRPAAP